MCWNVDVLQMVLSDSEKPKTFGNVEASNHCASVLWNVEIDYILVDGAKVYLGKIAIRWQKR